MLANALSKVVVVPDQSQLKNKPLIAKWKAGVNKLQVSPSSESECNGEWPFLIGIRILAEKLVSLTSFLLFCKVITLEKRRIFILLYLHEYIVQK